MLKKFLALRGLKNGGGNSGIGGSNDELIAALTDTLTEFRSSEITALRRGAFHGCSALTTIDMPNLKKVKDEAFHLSGLKNVNLPVFEGAEDASTNGIFRETKLEEITLPSFTVSGLRCFMSCTQLKKADFPVLQAFGSWMFAGCSSLNCLILRHDGVVSNGSTTCFQDTPFASGGAGGVVYVPQARIEEYKVATNWSALYEAGTCTFAAIEGSEYE